MRIIKLIAVFSVLLTAMISCWLHAGAQERASSPNKIEAQLAREPKNAKLQQQLAWAYFYEARQGKAESLEKAIQAFEQSMHMEPNYLNTQRGLGLAYFMKVAFLARSI
jgi:hypothetical protein